MSILDRGAIKARWRDLSYQRRSDHDAVVDAICDEIEAALPRLLAESKVDLIELAGFKLIDMAGEREKAEKEGRKPTLPQRDSLTPEYVALRFSGSGITESDVASQIIGNFWRERGAVDLTVRRGVVQARIPFDQVAACSALPPQFGWALVDNAT